MLYSNIAYTIYHVIIIPGKNPGYLSNKGEINCICIINCLFFI